MCLFKLCTYNLKLFNAIISRNAHLFRRLLALAAPSSGVVALLPADDGLIGSVLLPASSSRISWVWRANMP